MKYHELKTAPAKNKKRVGRGISAGGGKTAGRGTKGQNSRTGGGTRVGFEGGQNPLMQRVPKLAGFTTRRRATQTISLSDIDRLKEATIDNQLLHNKHITENLATPVKIVKSGEIKSKKTVNLQGASKGAIEAIEKAGGSFTRMSVPRPVSKKSTGEKK